jgi:hypothetical protein
VDGGVWIECSLDVEKNTNWCTAWSDQTGEVTARTNYVLKETGQGVPESELHYVSFNGHEIELVGGKVLEPLKFHGKEHDLWEPPPIDPPREESSSRSEQ